MADEYDTRAQDLRDTVKWVTTSMVSISSAIAGAAVLTRLGAVAPDKRSGAILLAVVILVAIVAAAAVAVWALSTAEPALADLLPELEQSSQNEPDARRQTQRRQQLERDIEEAAPVVQFKYRALADIGRELRQRREEWLAALRSARTPGALGAAWTESLPVLVDQLYAAYDDLREIATALRFVRLRRRVRIAVPLTVFLGTLVVGAMVPLVVLTQPPSPPTAAPVTTATPIDYWLLIDANSVTSPTGCKPAPKGGATAIGGTWERPLLVLTAEPETPRCEQAPPWLWRPAGNRDVIVTPAPSNGRQP